MQCVGMCRPFAPAQVVSGSERTTGPYGEWHRLAGAALVPYHLGRLTIYTALGAVVSGVTAVSIATTVLPGCRL
jgi:hypothetical protein